MPLSKQQKPCHCRLVPVLALSTIQSEQNVISIEPTFFWSECLQALHCGFVFRLLSFRKLLWTFIEVPTEFCMQASAQIWHKQVKCFVVTSSKIRTCSAIFSGTHENNTSTACWAGLKRNELTRKKNGEGLSLIIFSFALRIVKVIFPISS